MNGKLKPRNRSDSNLLDNTKDKNSKLQKTRNRSTTNLLDTKESNSNDKIFQTRNRSTTNLKVELKQSTDHHPNDKIQSKEQKSKVESVFVPLKGDEETIRKIPLKGEQDTKRRLIPTPLALASSNLDSPSTSLPSNIQSPIKTGMSVVRATPSSTSATPLVKPNRPAPSRPTVLDTIFQSPLVEDVPPLKDVDTLENHDSMTKVVDIDIMNSSSKPKQIDSTTNDKIAPTPSRSTLNPPKRPPPAIPNVNSPIIPIKGFHVVEDVKEKMGKAVDEDTAVDKVSDDIVEELGNTPVVDKKPLLGYQTINSKAKIPSHNEMQKFEKSNQDISVPIVEKTLPSPQKNLSFTHGKLLTPPKRAPPPVPAAISPLLFNTVPQCLPTVLISHPIPSIKVDPDTQVDPPTSKSISKESEMNHRKYPFIHNPLIVTRLRPLDKDSCASIVSEITSGSHSSSSLPSANTSQSNLLLNAPLGTSLSNVLSPTNVLNSSNSYSSPALNTTGLSSPTNSHFSLTTITPTLLIDSPNEGRYQRRRKEDAKKAKRRDLKCDELKVRNLLNQKAVDELTHQDIQDIKDLFKSLQVMVKDGENEEGLMFYKQLKRVIRGWQISDGLEKGMKSVDDLVVEGNEMRMMLREDEDLDTDQSLNDNGLKRVGEHVTVSDNVQHTVHVPTSKKVEIAKDNRDDSVYTIEDAKANEGMNGTMESKQFELETIKQEKSRLKRKLATLKEQYTIRNKNGDMVLR
ncbi:hypothetical protein BC833DRAFT_593858 [Globomyces pollinis-pini]|nr:hypothetical protein BC833DRAFT_593858 [Globomyces pollinis-pini]